MVLDLVCGKEVAPEAMKATVGRVPAGAPEVDPKFGTRRYYQGTWYYFCSVACRQLFVSRPDEFIQRSQSGT